MEKPNLNDIDAASVSLKELVGFIERLKVEHPIAVRVLAKRLMKEEYDGILQNIGREVAVDSEMPYRDKIMESFEQLTGDVQRQTRNETQAVIVLSLHSTFGFGRKRMLRLWGQAQEQFGGNSPTVEQLIDWCNRRGIDYDTEFGIGKEN